MDFRYELAFEFPMRKEDGNRFLERCADLEASMRGALRRSTRAEVNVSKMYSDAVKIVVFSDDPPERMLRRMRAVLDQHAPRPDWSVRFREVAGGEWTSLWPTDYNPERRCAGAAESPDEWSEPPDWKYQLVVQYSLADTDMRGFDDLIALELQIEAALADRTVAELDGNDVGSGEFNLFIFCDAPPTAFERIRPLLESASPPAGYRAAYRSLDDDDSAFHALWPPTLTEFSIA